MVMKIEGQIPFSECIYVAQFHTMLVNGLEVKIEISEICARIYQKKKSSPVGPYTYEN